MIFVRDFFVISMEVYGKKISDLPLGTSQIARLLNYYGYGKYDRTFDSTEELKTFPRD